MGSMNTTPRSRPVIGHPMKSILACPACKRELTLLDSDLHCNSCQLTFKRNQYNVFDLMPDSLPEAETSWRFRQQEMITWYQELATEADCARTSLEKDFEGEYQAATIARKTVDVYKDVLR